MLLSAAQLPANPAAPIRWPSAFGRTPAITVEFGGQRLNIPAQTVHFAPPPSVTVRTESVLLYAVPQNLPHAFVDDLALYRRGTCARLTCGVDYAFDGAVGQIIGLHAHRDVPVDVEYVGRPVRCDALFADPETLSIAAIPGGDVLGSGRASDPNTAIPRCPPGGIPLFRALLAEGRGAELLPLYPFGGLIERGDEAEYYAWLHTTREQLSGVWKKLGDGALRLAGYGDCITAQGPGDGRDLRPGGPHRDSRLYFLGGRIGEDALSSLSDGLRGTRCGWNWALKAALEQVSGARVAYENWGLPTTTSGPDMIAGLPHGLHPERLGALIRARPDLVTLSFGMNELGSPSFYRNTVEMVRALQSSGIDTIVIGTPLVNVTSARPGLLKAWRSTYDAARRAAEDTDTAFLPVARWADPTAPGVLGISPSFVCETNAFNRPGPYELGLYGEMLAAIVPPVL